MKTFLFVLAFSLLISFPALAIFCTSCGANLPDQAKFCAKCGAKILPANPAPVKPAVGKPVKEKPEPAKPEPVASETEKTPVSLEGTFRTKTDLYLYDKRGDEHNVLKKNLFFKPRRSRLQANGEFKILESVGDTFLVQSLPDSGGKVLKGWVTQSELELRTTWKK